MANKKKGAFYNSIKNKLEPSEQQDEDWAQLKQEEREVEQKKSEDMLKADNKDNMVSLASEGTAETSSAGTALNQPLSKIEDKVEADSMDKTDNKLDQVNTNQPENKDNMVYPLNKDSKESMRGDKSGKVTFYAGIDMVENLERASFWERRSIKMIIGELLDTYFADKSYEPIPERLKPSKRGPKPKEESIKKAGV